MAVLRDLLRRDHWSACLRDCDGCAITGGGKPSVDREKHRRGDLFDSGLANQIS